MCEPCSQTNWEGSLEFAQELLLGGAGHGRLIQAKAIQFQNYYRGAVMDNICNSKAMRKVIWATIFHCASTEDNPQHDKCSQVDASTRKQFQRVKFRHPPPLNKFIGHITLKKEVFCRPIMTKHPY